MATTEKTLRASIIAHCARIAAAGLGGPPDGDISARVDNSLLITPTAADYASLEAGDDRAHAAGRRIRSLGGPDRSLRANGVSTSTSCRARPDVGAIVRFQSPCATALAMAHKDPSPPRIR